MPINIVGDKVNSLHTTGDLWVEVQLNNDEPTAKELNKNKKAPQHYQNVVGQPFLNAVLVEESSCIQFKIRSRGKVGFGYRIVGGLKLGLANKVLREEAEPDIIASQLYCLPPVSENDIFELDDRSDLYDVATRYQSEDRSLITVAGFKSVGLSSDDRSKLVTMMNCTVTSWEVYGFIDDDTDIDYGHPADINKVEWGPTPEMDRRTIRAPGATLQKGTSLEVKKVRNVREDFPAAAPNYVNFTFLVERSMTADGAAKAAGGGPIRVVQKRS